MSTKGTTYYDDQVQMDWVPTAKPWCPSCCVPLRSCGCPEAERIMDDSHLIRGCE